MATPHRLLASVWQRSGAHNGATPACIIAMQAMQTMYKDVEAVATPSTETDDMLLGKYVLDHLERAHKKEKKGKPKGAEQSTTCI